jgi:hypothetical protein
MGRRKRRRRRRRRRRRKRMCIFNVIVNNEKFTYISYKY